MATNLGMYSYCYPHIKCSAALRLSVTLKHHVQERKGETVDLLGISCSKHTPISCPI